MIDPRSHYDRAGEIFEAIVDLPVAERESALAEECGDDIVLRDLVSGMLSHDRELVRAPLVDSIAGRLAEGHDVLAAEVSRKFEIGGAEGYRFLRPLGEGGMGSVWLAEQDNPRRQVACKVILPWQESDHEQRRFEREIDALARLRDPGITRIFAAGIAETSLGRRPFFSMEYVDGPDILSWAVESELSTRERVALFVPVCDAVHHAHREGVIHRDLKPANILVDTRDGPRTKVLDFGVARILDDSARGATLHGDGRLFGTLPYMPPEQAAGRSDDIGPATDVYALGACLYHLIAGRLPVELTGLGLTEAIAKIREVEPLRLDAPVGDVPADLDVVVRKALSKSPERRYRSAAAFAEDLRAWLGDRAVTARPPGAVERLARFARKNRATVIGAALTLVVAVTGSVVATTYAVRANRAERRADAERELARIGRYVAEVGAGLALADVDPRAARSHLEAAPSAFRGWEWRHLAGRVDRLLESREIAGGFADEGVAVAWSDDGRPVAVAASDEGVVLHSGGVTGTPRSVALGGEASFLRMASDATRVGCVVMGERGEDVVVIDVASAKVLWRQATGHERRVRSLEFDARFNEARAVCGFQSVRRVRPSGVESFDGLIEKCSGAAGDATGVTWVSHRDDAVPKLSRVVDGEVLAVTVETRMPLVRATPAGLIGVDEFRLVRRFDPVTMAMLGTFVGHLRSPHVISVTPDGGRMATASRDGTVRTWDVESGAQLSVIPVTAHDLAISSDGERVVVATDRGLEVLRTSRCDAPLVLQHDDYLQAAEFCLGDRVVVVGGFDAVLHFHDAETGRLLGRCRVPDATAAIQAMGVRRDEEHVVAFAQWQAASFDVATLKEVEHERAWDDIRDGSHMRGVQGMTRVVHDGRLHGNDASGIVDQERRVDVLALPRRCASFAMAPDGAVALVMGRRIELHRRGRAVVDVAGHADSVYSMAFAPDGERFVSAGNDSTVRIWSVDPLMEMACLRGHDSYVHSASWSSDGTRIVTAGGDGRAILFDSRSLRQRESIRLDEERRRRILRSLIARRLDAGDAPGAIARDLRGESRFEGVTLDVEMRRAGLFCLLERVGGE